MRSSPFKPELLPRKKWFSDMDLHLFDRKKKNRSERHEWLHRKAAAAQMSIFRWFYRYFLTASFEASQGTVPKRRFSSNRWSWRIPFLTTPLRKNDVVWNFDLKTDAHPKKKSQKYSSGPRREHHFWGARVLRANLGSRCDDPVERGMGEVNLSPRD